MFSRYRFQKNQTLNSMFIFFQVTFLLHPEKLPFCNNLFLVWSSHYIFYTNRRCSHYPSYESRFLCGAVPSNLSKQFCILLICCHSIMYYHYLLLAQNSPKKENCNIIGVIFILSDLPSVF